MRLAICGSTGFIGTALTGSLVADGHDVLRLVRREPTGPGEMRWDPALGDVDPTPLEGMDAVVNLAGAGIGDRRWNRAYKEELRLSRIRATAVLSRALASLDKPPRVFISASASGIYGADRGSEVLDEDSAPQDDFLSRLCVEWEAAAQPAKEAGIAVVHPRFGLVMDRSGGAMARMLPLFRLGLGGPMGSGEQYWSHVSLTDTVRALRFLIDEQGCVGAYNITAPQPATNATFARLLAYTLNRPTLLPAPRIGLRIALGEYATYVAGGLLALPRRLTEAGFEHRHPDARAVIADALKEKDQR